MARTMVDYKCEQCGMEFTAGLSRSKPRKFCSKACFSAYSKKHYQPIIVYHRGQKVTG